MALAACEAKRILRPHAHSEFLVSYQEHSLAQANNSTHTKLPRIGTNTGIHYGRAGKESDSREGGEALSRALERPRRREVIHNFKTKKSPKDPIRHTITRGRPRPQRLLLKRPFWGIAHAGMTVIMVAAALVLGFAEFPKDIGLSEDKTRQLMQAVERITSAEYRASRSSQVDVAAANVATAAGEVEGAQQALNTALGVVSTLDTPPLGHVANYAFGLGMQALGFATSVPLGPIDTERSPKR